MATRRTLREVLALLPVTRARRSRGSSRHASWRGLPWRRLRPRTHRSAAVLALVLLGALWWTRGGPAPAATWPREQILLAIRLVESGGRDTPPDGDGGRAIGPFQIHEVYWRDAVSFDPSLGGSYQDCRKRAYATRVVDAYMRCYAPAAWAAGEAETIARVHNGGPSGAKKQATLGYWRRVRAKLPPPD